MGGTGLENLILQDARTETITTPYGVVTVDIGHFGGQNAPLVFMSRHGKGHTLPPHLVNYRANIWALQELGVRKIIATAAVGSLASRLQLGDIVLMDQFLDFTKSRPHTFYEGGEQGVLHVDMTEPYCKSLQAVIRVAGEAVGVPLEEGATYVCTEGPRFETPAEIRMYQMLGGECVGMTSVPEVVLAKECGMCYATIGMITNEAAGIADHPLTHEEVIVSMKATGKTVAQLIQETFRILRPEQDCRCQLGNSEVGKF
ncbi:purine nucleoside phosphorylase [Desulfitobacterium dichloroeliminans LMG P-21439]|uniref:Probable 6-oxopurine nucleoside phosphorylase n=1 Tax=Desulfitobacterium dichloroeliminans (strain LMG P-21439 / DCA1) TaxID=871963 RepID=L0FBQ9_DESDL|nr:purine nucleoside phosphorylase [Desulfitobacterium dichloroeliminans LMG P-21439]